MNCISKRLFCHVNCPVRALKTYNGSLYHNQSMLLSLLTNHTQRFFSTKPEKDDSFTVSYLINSFGFSPESAKSISKHLKLKSSQRPDSVIKLFSDLGFTKIQISKLTQRYPNVLLLDPQKILKPKIEFFYSIGMSRSDVAIAFSFNPTILGRSLERQIVPRFEVLKQLLGSNSDAIRAIKYFPEVLRPDCQSHLIANVSILKKDYGVPHSNIMLLIIRWARVALIRSDQFKAIVDAVAGMGINPMKSSFVLGIYLKGVISESKWERKLNVYRSFGWSEDEIRKAWVRDPRCMSHSEQKMRKVMDILVNESGWKSLDIARSPNVLGLSLKNRIIPRSSVMRFLFSKGLIDQSVKLSTVFYSSEKLFLEKFVAAYVDNASFLSRLYKEQMNQSEQAENS